jgi:spore coat polysaccharide biosynthesis protein SpsF
MPVDPEVNWPQLRLTVDTPEDFELITRIFDELYTPGLVFSLEDIVELCRCKPELVAINAGIEQKPAKPIKISGGVGEPDPMTA